MKKGVLILFFFGLILSTYGESRADRRAERQAERIANGVENGDLSEKEQRRLERGQKRIDGMAERFNEDGEMTKREKRRLNKAQNRQSRRIRRKKNN